ncbi:MFS transporter [Streptomyces laurentii]|uniref:MFS transporter n=1 Tax=Streptomyces laurentii TaxID=39478 RepID=UPI003682BF61
MTTTVPRPVREEPSVAGRRPRALLGVVLAAQFMALLDVFIVNVAAPTIRGGLGASGAGIQLVVAGYTIAYAVLLITGARFGERLGHRRVYLGGLALFTAASLACGLAAGTGPLIAFRVVQGAGSALMIPQVLSLIQRHFTGEARARALSAYAAVLATGTAAGQVVGGVLVSADLFGTGWRPVFLVNVPLGLVLLFLGAKVLPRDTAPRDATLGGTAPGGTRRARALDVPGLLLLAGSVSLLTVPLVLGQESGWPPWTWLSLGGSLLLFAAFGAYEARLARRGGAPLLAPRVLRAPGIGRAVVRIAAAMAVNAGFLFTLTLHLQGGLGQSALRTGLTFGPTAVVFGLVGLTWRRWPARLHPFLVPGGFLLAAVSALAVGAVLKGGGTGGWLLYPAFCGMGAGLALAFNPALTSALATVRPSDAADASGLLATVTQLGQLIGVATVGSLFLGRITGPGADVSARALWVCAFALALTALVGACAGAPLRRRRPPCGAMAESDSRRGMRVR